jgi:hypothetical protein
VSWPFFIKSYTQKGLTRNSSGCSLNIEPHKGGGMSSQSNKEYIQRQRIIMLNPHFIKKVQVALGHVPTRNDLVEFWINEGFARAFHRKFKKITT